MKNKIKCISFIMIVTIMLLTIKSNAAMAIKPGTTTWTSINVSDSYAQCYNLRNADSTLGANQLDPHLTLNKDWGAVAYLAISTYGSVNSSTLPTTTINGASYTTTNGNATGVMNMGNIYTQTASDNENDTHNYADMIEIYNNIETKYVEKLSSNPTSDTTVGQALVETISWFGSANDYGIPTLYRWKVLGYTVSSGNGSYNTTFRPVIWNIK